MSCTRPRNLPCKFQHNIEDIVTHSFQEHHQRWHSILQLRQGIDGICMGRFGMWCWYVLDRCPGSKLFLVHVIVCICEIYVTLCDTLIPFHDTTRHGNRGVQHGSAWYSLGVYTAIVATVLNAPTGCCNVPRGAVPLKAVNPVALASLASTVSTAPRCCCWPSTNGRASSKSCSESAF